MFKQRKQNRLPGYDYSSEGYYFITICTHNKIEVFGTIKNNVMVLSPDGIIAQHKWLEIPEHHEYAIPEDFVIMPNHVHGIIQIKGQVQAGLNPTGPQYSKLTTTIGSFKSGVSREIGRTNCSHEFKWQKSFYDHIIRDEFSYYNIVKYIAENPLKWALDIENSAVEGHLEQYYENIYRGIE